MTYVRNGKRWINEHPITDAYEALAILAKQSSSAIPHHIDTNRQWLAEPGCPEIVYTWHRDGDSGGDMSSEDRLDMEQEVAQTLRERRWVEPRRIPQWGHTETRDDELVISGEGREALAAHINTLQEAARKLIIPGKHTKYSGTLFSRGWGLEDYWCGEIYFEYTTPMKEDGLLRVFPKSGRVEKVG